MKTFNLKPADVTRKWYIIDASEATLGRLASAVAKLLIGKSKPEYSPHVDSGDYVVVINAQSLKVTGNKLNDKFYFRHSGYPGNLKKETLAEKINNAPSEVIYIAVRGMLPVNKLRDGRLSRLKIFDNVEHTHQGQNPQTITLKELK